MGSGAKDVGLSAMLSGIALLREQKVVAFDPLMKAVVAEAEADRDEFDAAFVVLNEALAGSERTGQRWFDAELHRIHGEILLKQDPANTAPAEDAFLTAIAIAQYQKARSFELRAALSLAKLYRAMRPRRRRPRRARPRAGRAFADAGVSGDRGGFGNVANP